MSAVNDARANGSNGKITHEDHLSVCRENHNHSARSHTVATKDAADGDVSCFLRLAVVDNRSYFFEFFPYMEGALSVCTEKV